MSLNVVFEGCELTLNGAAERGYITVSHSSGGRGSEYFRCKNVGGVGAASYVCGLCSVGGCPGTVGAAAAKLTYRLLGASANSAGLGGNGHLMVHNAEQRRLKYLSLNDWGLYGYDRFPWEGNLSLSHSVNISGKLHL